MKRLNPKAPQIVRGFRLGLLYAQGEVLTSSRIRRLLRVSRATAKRDMRAVATLVKVTPSKANGRQREHFPRMAALGRRDGDGESHK